MKLNLDEKNANGNAKCMSMHLAWDRRPQASWRVAAANNRVKASDPSHIRPGKCFDLKV